MRLSPSAMDRGPPPTGKYSAVDPFSGAGTVCPAHAAPPPCHVTTAGGKAAPNPLLPVIDRAHRSIQVALEELLRPRAWAIAPAAPAADGTLPEPERSWLRHPNETAKAHAAFRYYRDLGAQRSIPKVTQKLTISDTLASRRSHASRRRVRPLHSRSESLNFLCTLTPARCVLWGHVARPRQPRLLGKGESEDESRVKVWVKTVGRRGESSGKVRSLGEIPGDGRPGAPQRTAAPAPPLLCRGRGREKVTPR